jgi:predicted AAA+ superfamily ATPase
MIKRHLTERILTALDDAPVVYLQGARQTGKSTLVRMIAKNRRPAEYYSLDTLAVSAAAQDDPEGFVAGLNGPVVIDEVQKAPMLLPAIKSAVDADRKPGRFLLTGSASVLTLPAVSESLVGRMELHTLWPFSQGEICATRESFVEKVFQKKFSPELPDKISQERMIKRILSGGYPDAIARKTKDRRDAWFDSYATTLLHRDVRDLANIEKLSDMPRLLRVLASRAGSLLNYADLSRSMSSPQTTVKRHIALLESLFLVKLLPAWAANLGKRLVKSPKLLFADSGLLAFILDLDAKRIRDDRTRLGPLLENFAAMELFKQLGWSKKRCNIHHFRTENGAEVDLVLEDPAGQMVGIEVKSTSSINAHDFKGLKALAEIAGDRFVRGLILYLGDLSVPFARNLAAMPINTLWA